MIETLPKEDRLPDGDDGKEWSLDSWEEAMRDHEGLEDQSRSEEEELEYYRSIERCFGQRAMIDYAFTRYGQSIFESDREKADALLEEHLEAQDESRRRAESQHQERLLNDYRQMSAELSVPDDGEVLDGWFSKSA